MPLFAEIRRESYFAWRGQAKKYKSATIRAIIAGNQSIHYLADLYIRSIGLRIRLEWNLFKHLHLKVKNSTKHEKVYFLPPPVSLGIFQACHTVYSINELQVVIVWDNLARQDENIISTWRLNFVSFLIFELFSCDNSLIFCCRGNQRREVKRWRCWWFNIVQRWTNAFPMANRNKSTSKNGWCGKTQSKAYLSFVTVSIEK